MTFLASLNDEFIGNMGVSRSMTGINQVVCSMFKSDQVMVQELMIEKSRARVLFVMIGRV